MKPINVLSLFDGISCGRVALERAGIPVNKYYASEIDKYAMQISKKNWPEIIQLGDVQNWKEWDIDWSSISLLFAGFPCQSWSIAGKQLGDKDPRGALMWTMLDILNHIKSVNPNVKFLFENVKMKKENLEYVNKAIGVVPVEINSALVSAQNRKRLYWQNIGETEQPKDKGIMLKDIIEDSPSSPTYMSETFVERFLGYGKKLTTSNQEKGKCLSASEYVKNGKQGDYLIEEPFCSSSSMREGGIKEDRISQNAKAHTLTKAGYGIKSFTGVLQINNSRESGGKQPFMQNRVYYPSGKSVCLTSSFSNRANALDGLMVRKLTPVECERLQTLPDNYTDGVSDTQRYKAIGNGWTVDVIAHILKGLKNEI